MATVKKLELKVADSPLKSSVTSPIVYLGLDSMEALGLNSGDVIEIKGAKTTAALVRPQIRTYRKKGAIQLGALVRQNCGRLEGKVTVRKTNVKDAKKVIATTKYNEVLKFKAFGDHVRKVLMERPIHAGDEYSIGTIGVAVPIKIKKTEPKGTVRVKETSVFDIRPMKRSKK